MIFGILGSVVLKSRTNDVIGGLTKRRSLKSGRMSKNSFHWSHVDDFSFSQVQWDDKF